MEASFGAARFLEYDGLHTALFDHLGNPNLLALALTSTVWYAKSMQYFAMKSKWPWLHQLPKVKLVCTVHETFSLVWQDIDYLLMRRCRVTPKASHMLDDDESWESLIQIAEKNIKKRRGEFMVAGAIVEVSDYSCARRRVHRAILKKDLNLLIEYMSGEMDQEMMPVRVVNKSLSSTLLFPTLYTAGFSEILGVEPHEQVLSRVSHLSVDKLMQKVRNMNKKHTTILAFCKLRPNEVTLELMELLCSCSESTTMSEIAKLRDTRLVEMAVNCGLKFASKYHKLFLGVNEMSKERLVWLQKVKKSTRLDGATLFMIRAGRIDLVLWALKERYVTNISRLIVQCIHTHCTPLLDILWTAEEQSAQLERVLLRIQSA